MRKGCLNKLSALCWAVVALGFVYGASVHAAEEPVAKITTVEGAGALVNDGQRLVSATPGMPLWPGFIVEAPEGGKAVVRYDNGCEIAVEERQRLEIAELDECRKLVALLSGGAAAVGAGAAIAGLGGGLGFVAGTTGAVLAVGLARGGTGGPVSAE